MPDGVDQGGIRVFITFMATYVGHGELMARPSYPSDVTHEEWQLLKPELPNLTAGCRPPIWERLQVRVVYRVCLAQSAA